MTTIDRKNWATQARCAGVDTEIFFPVGGPGYKAARICASCPVAQWCMTESMTEKYGIFGGAGWVRRTEIRREFGILDEQDHGDHWRNKAKEIVAAGMDVLEGAPLAVVADRYGFPRQALRNLLADHVPERVRRMRGIDRRARADA